MPPDHAPKLAIVDRPQTGRSCYGLSTVDALDSVVEAHLAWLRLRGLRETTATQRRYALARLARATGKALLDIDSDDLRAWQHQRLGKLTAVAHCTEVMHVGCFYAWAVDEGLLEANPARRLIRPKKPRRVPRPIPEDRLRTAILCAPRHLRAPLVCAAFQGMRVGEIARLQRHDILDAHNPPVIVIDGKGGRERIVPMLDVVWRELCAAGLPAHGHVFRRLDGHPGGITPSRMSQMINRYLHELGIPETCHQLRHRYATQLYRLSEDLRMVQDLMGHADPATTAAYVAYAPSKALSASALLAETFPSAARPVTTLHGEAS